MFRRLFSTGAFSDFVRSLKSAAPTKATSLLKAGHSRDTYALLNAQAAERTNGFHQGRQRQNSRGTQRNEMNAQYSCQTT